MASTMNSYSINTEWLEAVNYNTIVYDTINVNDGSYTYRLQDYGVGKIVLTRLTYNCRGYPQIQTPYAPAGAGDFLVFLQGSTSYPVNCKESLYWWPFVYMGVFSSTENLCLMPSNDFYIIHIRISN